MKHLLKKISLAIVATVVLSLSSLGAASAQAASVRYTISPASGNIQPNGYVSIALSITTSVPIAGVSVHVNYGNGSYSGFQTASAPQFNFVTYHPEQGDILVICNNNRCDPGTYPIGTLVVQVAGAGTTSVGFEPKETANPDLNLIPATGTSGSYGITSTAPASTSQKPSGGSTSSVPRTSGSSGGGNSSSTGSSTGSQTVTGDQLNSQFLAAQNGNNLSTAEALKQAQESGPKSFWSTRNIVIAAILAVIVVGGAVFVLLRLRKRRPPTSGMSNPGNYPGMPQPPQQNSTIITPKNPNDPNP